MQLAPVVVGVRRRERDRGVGAGVALQHGDVAPVVRAEELAALGRVQEEVVEQVATVQEEVVG